MKNEERELCSALGQELQLARLNAKDKQDDIAKILQCSRTHVSDLETGKAPISAYELKVYATRYNLNVTNLLLYNGSADILNSIKEHFTNEQLKIIFDLLTSANKMSEINKNESIVNKTIDTRVNKQSKMHKSPMQIFADKYNKK